MQSTQNFTGPFRQPKTKSSVKRTIHFLGQCRAGVTQGSSLRPLFFFTYPNDLSKDLPSNAKLLAHDISLFLVFRHRDTSRTELNDDLSTIKNSAFQWKISFNPDPSKLAQKKDKEGEPFPSYSQQYFCNLHYISKAPRF